MGTLEILREDWLWKKIQEEEEALKEMEAVMRKRKSYLGKLREEYREISQGRLLDESQFRSIT